MMTGLMIVLGMSLILFIGSLAVAVTQDWAQSRKIYQKLIAENLGVNGRPPMNSSFVRASRRPMRVLGTFIL